VGLRPRPTELPDGDPTEVSGVHRIFTGEGEKALLQLRKRLPASLGMFLAEYHTKLGSAVIDDPRYELRLRVLQELDPKDPNVSRFSSPTSTT